jgi:hypothetical protein
MKLKLKQTQKDSSFILYETQNYDYEPESDLDVIEHYLKLNNAMSTFFSL